MTLESGKMNGNVNRTGLRMIRQDLIEDYQNKLGESPSEEWLEEQMAALSMATAESAAS